MLALFPWFVLRWAQMWLETKENNEQLREEVEVAKEELSNTKKKLEEALVVCVHRSLPFLSLYQQSFKPFHQVPCYSAALLSPRPVSFDILTHWIKNNRKGKIVVWPFNHTDSDNNNERFLQGELARAQRQERLEREKLNEKLEAVEAQMQVQTRLEPSILFQKTFFWWMFSSYWSLTELLTDNVTYWAVLDS